MNTKQIAFIVLDIIPGIVHISGANMEGARANVTLRLALNYDINPECDETVYKAMICAGEFTNECLLFGPVARFLQASCASQGATEPINFLVNSVESPIELDVTVQRVGENSVQRLRRTEFRLTEGGEIAVTSFDLTLIVRFHAEYVCLPNYFGKLCDKFCDTKAVNHVCDEWGNTICRSGYFPDSKTGACRHDQCISQPDYCKNGGTCVTNPNPTSSNPLCLCNSDFTGVQCEIRQTSTALPSSLTIVTSQAFETTTEDKNELFDRKSQSLTSGRKNDKSSRSVNDQNSPNLTSAPTDAQPNVAHSPGNTPSTTAKSPDLFPAVFNTRHQGLIEREDRIHAAFGETEPAYRTAILPVFIGILMLSLLVACVAFLVWAVAQRKWKKDRNKPKRITPPTTLPITESQGRWASVDKSPIRLFPPFESSLFTNPDGIPSLKDTQYSFLSDPTVNEAAYGVSLPTGLYAPNRFSATETTNIFGLSSDSPWAHELDRFSTIPRPCSTFVRRSATDLTVPISPYSPSDLCSQFATQTNPLSTDISWIPPRPHANTIPGIFQMADQQQRSLYVTTSEAMERSMGGQYGCPASSVRNALDSFHTPTTHFYGPLAPACYPYVPVTTTNLTGEPIMESFVPTTAEEDDRMEPLVMAHPPPPTEFADTYPGSRC